MVGQGMPRPWHKTALRAAPQPVHNNGSSLQAQSSSRSEESDQVDKHSVKLKLRSHGKTGVMPGQLTVSRTSESASFISCTRPATPACFT